MWYTRRLLSALQSSKLRGTEPVPLSDNTLREVILRALGKPTSTDEIRYFKRSRNAKAVAPCFAGEIRPKLRLVATAIEHSELPEATLPEVAFYGRTNSGKSCLINAICGRFGVCTVKDLPGTTRKIHFYKVGTPSSIILVDLPGYGFSAAKEDITLQWNEFTLSYLKHKESLKLVVILVDSRHGLKQSDREVINFCDKYKIRWQIVMAKADTMKPVLLAKMMHKVRLEASSFRSSNGRVVAISATKNQNLDEIRAILDAFKVDKHTARFWSNAKTSRKSEDKTKTPEFKLAEPTKVPVIEPEGRVEMADYALSEIHSSEAITHKYDLWKYIDETDVPYTKDSVAWQCVAEIFDTMTPPAGLLEYVPPQKDAAPVEIPIEPIVRKPAEPTFVEMDGSLMCNLNISLGATLARNEQPEAVQENLLQDKLASYKRRIAMGLQTSPSISRPQIGRSYKRVLSLYKKELKPKRLQWNVLDQNKLTWSAVYQKWEKWSRKHPQLAGTIESPTKRDVIASGRKKQIRKHQLQVHEQRKELRQSSPKINNKLPS